MTKKILVMVIVVTAAFLIFSLVMAQEKEAKAEKTVEAKFEYVGADKCKMCHKKDGIHDSWLATKHATAWEALKPEQQKDEKCVGCHTTGKLADGTILEGVQCEACHGPGSAYKKKSIMEDREKAIANGLLIPNEKTCLGCHNENVPEEFRSKEKFDYAKMKAKGVHAAKKEEAKEEKKEG